MESRNKLTMCRLCLCENESYINIFERSDWQGYVAAEVISDLLQFKVSETDGYPHVVCSKCIVKLTDFKLFKECCQKSKVVYDDMFFSCESMEDHNPEMGIGDGGSILELHEKDPLREASSDPIIKQEELDISGDESEEPCAETNTKVSIGPILLKHEVLSFSGDRHTQEKFIETDAFGNAEAVEPATTSVDDSTQEEEEEEERETTPEKGIEGRNGRFECHCCRKVLTTKKGLKRHLACHGIGAFFECKVCGKISTSKSNLKRHSRLHTGEKPYKCTDCTAVFKNGSNLKDHMRVHTKTKPFKCKECNLSFSQSSHLKRHVRVHADSKPYSCGVCHMNFRVKGNLKKHMSTHSRDRPHKCIVCSKEFSCIEYLRKHQVVHLEEKHYSCTHCGKCFSRRDSLKTHQVVHSGERPHSCPHCDKRFSLMQHLSRHLKTVCVGKC